MDGIIKKQLAKTQFLIESLIESIIDLSFSI
jgi:hypothetical protein